MTLPDLFLYFVSKIKYLGVLIHCSAEEYSRVLLWHFIGIIKLSTSILEMLEPNVSYPYIFSLNIVPRASNNTNSYNLQGSRTKCHIAARQTTTEDFVTKATMFAVEHITGQQVLSV